MAKSRAPAPPNWRAWRCARTRALSTEFNEPFRRNSLRFRRRTDRQRAASLRLLGGGVEASWRASRVGILQPALHRHRRSRDAADDGDAGRSAARLGPVVGTISRQTRSIPRANAESAAVRRRAQRL